MDHRDIGAPADGQAHPDVEEDEGEEGKEEEEEEGSLKEELRGVQLNLFILGILFVNIQVQMTKQGNLLPQRGTQGCPKMRRRLTALLRCHGMGH